MTVENISWSISTKECCRPRRGLNPRPPGLQSDGASNWATEAGNMKGGIVMQKKGHFSGLAWGATFSVFLWVFQLTCYCDHLLSVTCLSIRLCWRMYTCVFENYGHFSSIFQWDLFCRHTNWLICVWKSHTKYPFKSNFWHPRVLCTDPDTEVYIHQDICRSVNCPSICLSSVCPLIPLNDFSSETHGQIFFKFHVEPSVTGGLKICSDGHSPLSKMAAMPMYGKHTWKSSSPEPRKLYSWILVYGIVYSRSTKFVQMMLIDWPLNILGQGKICIPMHLFGENIEKSFSQNVLITNSWNLQCMYKVVKLF